MLDSLLSWLHAMGGATNSPLVLAALGAAAAIEYIVPPFPGDSITLLGGVLVSAFHWNLFLIFASVMLGSVLGSLAAYALGKRLAAKATKSSDSKLMRLVARFETNGTWLLLINRFLPGIRPFFFVAAGMTGLSIRRVALLSSISAALWNAAIMAAGIAVGDNLERLEELLLTYSKIAWILLTVVVIGIFVRSRLRKPQ